MKKGEDFIGVCVVYFCHDGKGNFVMAKRSQQARDEAGRWDIGGGGVEFGEQVETSLRKEIKEEYCTDVLGFEFLGFRDVHREKDGKSTHWIALDFKALVDPAKVRIGEPHKFDGLKWYNFKTFDFKPEQIHSQLPHFLEKYKDLL